MDGNTFTQVVGIAAGIFTSLSLLPQIIKSVREKKAQDISLFYLLVLLTGLSLWTYYGFLRKDVPLIATNILSLILNATMIVLGVRYKNKSQP
jgi:MtN3 and saliva related transmembrane protein